MKNEIIGYKHKSNLIFMREDGKSMRYDLADNSFYSGTKNGNWRKVDGAYTFFKGHTAATISNTFESPVHAQLLSLVNRVETRCSNVGTLFSRLHKYLHLESYLAVGVKLESPFVSRWSGPNIFKGDASQFQKEVLAFMRESGIEFGNSWEARYARHSDIIIKVCTFIRKHYHMDLEVYGWVYSMLKSYHLENFQTLTDVYGCEYKALLKYLINVERREALPFSNALQYLKDYLSMNRTMRNARAVKYPENLTMVHNIVVRNYNTWTEKFDEDEFLKSVDLNFEYKYGKYQMLVPITPQEIKEEGNQLHHCVKSYIRRVMDGSTKITFMRENRDESLITVEIKGGEIVQARGYNNRPPTDTEKVWLKTYAKAKNIKYDVQINEYVEEGD